jgi:hypothetical protein
MNLAAVEAGVERLESVLDCGGPTYVVEEVYRAMALAKLGPKVRE